MIAELFGHTQVQTTARYAHLARHVEKTGPESIADSLSADLNTAPDNSSTA